MTRKSAGFTLIELVVVIVILGVLAAVAAPRFINLSDEADQAATDAQASALAAASAMNYAAVVLGNAAGDGTITDCDQIPTLLDGSFDTGRFSVASEAIGTDTVGETEECDLTGPGNSTPAVFTGIRTST